MNYRKADWRREGKYSLGEVDLGVWEILSGMLNMVWAHWIELDAFYTTRGSAAEYLANILWRRLTSAIQAEYSTFTGEHYFAFFVSAQNTDAIIAFSLRVLFSTSSQVYTNIVSVTDAGLSNTRSSLLAYIIHVIYIIFIITV